MVRRTSPSGPLSGTVREKDSGAPLEGARLALRAVSLEGLPIDPEAQPLVTSTDESGRYSFPGLPAGTNELVCSLEGHGTLEVRYITFHEEGPAELQHDLALEPGRWIAGHVVGPDGVGVTGAQVEAVTYQQGFSCRGAAVTGATGEFSIEGLVEGEYVVSVTADGWDSEPTLGIEALTTDLILRIDPRSSVHGRVLDGETFLPVTSFELIVRRGHPTDLAYGEPVLTRSFEGRADGSFRIDDLSDVDYVIEARAAGYASSFSTPFEIERGRPAPWLDVHMAEAGVCPDAWWIRGPVARWPGPRSRRGTTTGSTPSTTARERRARPRR